MADRLFSLVYYSRNHIEGKGDAFNAQVNDILARSRENNSRDGITGALLFNAGVFAQVLEGAQPVVEAAFERIQQDDRHGDVSLLSFSPIEKRSFPNWAMGYVGTSAQLAARFSAVGESSGFELDRLSGVEVHRVLKSLAIEEESQAA